MQPAPLVSLLLVLSTGCVPSVPHFVTSAEARAGRPYEDAAYEAARIDPGLQPTAPARAGTGELASAAYWHWDGLKYVWLEGETEAEAPAYLWQWQSQPR